MVTAVLGKRGKLRGGIVASLRTKQIKPKVGDVVELVKCNPYSGHAAAAQGIYKICNKAAYPYGGSKNYFIIQDQDRKDKFILETGSAFKRPSAKAIEEFVEKLRTAIPREFHTKRTSCTGSDPELFVVGEHERPIAAFNFLPDKKDAAQTDHSYFGHGKLFWDGVQAEFTVPPGGCHSYVIDGFRAGMVTLLRHAKAVDPKAKLVPDCVMDVPDDMLQTGPERGIALGCKPSLNAYGSSGADIAALDARGLKFRFAGCHVHLSSCAYYKIDDKNIENVIKSIDRVAGVFSVGLLRGLEDARRRQYYGLAGEYRVPSYGLEYRTLSSAMLCHPSITHLLLDLVRAGAAMALGGQDELLSDIDDSDVQSCINNLDADLADKIIDSHSKVFLGLIEQINTNGKLALEMAHKGAKEFLDPHKMKENWKLENDWLPHSNHERAEFRCFRPKK